MFQKKQYIYSESQGVCQVENIVSLSAKKNGESVQYYVLRPVYEPEQVAYIPVENHQVGLRDLFTIEEALQLQNNPEIKKNERLKAAVSYVLQNGGLADGTATGHNS